MIETAVVISKVCYRCKEEKEASDVVKTWDAIADIERARIAWSVDIIKCCKGKRDSFRGFKWQYA